MFHMAVKRRIAANSPFHMPSFPSAWLRGRPWQMVPELTNKNQIISKSEPRHKLFRHKHIPHELKVDYKKSTDRAQEFCSFRNLLTQRVYLTWQYYVSLKPWLLIRCWTNVFQSVLLSLPSLTGNAGNVYIFGFPYIQNETTIKPRAFINVASEDILPKKTFEAVSQQSKGVIN
jgi:hypothetical protein